MANSFYIIDLVIIVYLTIIDYFSDPYFEKDVAILVNFDTYVDLIDKISTILI